MTLGHHDDLDGRRTVEKLEAHTHTVLDAAWEAGIRYFDVARSYGRGEAFLGRWLRARDVDPDAVGVGSKWGYTYTAGWEVDAEVHEVKEHSLARLQRQWPESRECLGDQLDLYQIHSATLSTGVLQNDAVHAELARLKREEGIAIGLSLSGPRQAKTLDAALAVTVDGERLFDAVQATWNLLERSAGPALQRAHDAGLGVIVKEALSNGRLTPRNDDPAFAPTRTRLQAQADRLGTTLDALALGAALAQPWSDVVLSGAATIEHLHSNVRALDDAWDADAADALQDVAEPSQAYWDRRDELAWT